MLAWIVKMAFIGFFCFTIYVFLLAFNLKLFAKLVLVISLLLALQVTIDCLYPVVKQWQARLDSVQNSIDRGASAIEKVSSLGQGGVWEMPMSGQITQYFGENHHGIDIANDAGTPIRAQADGHVTWADTLDIYGLTVIIKYDNGHEAVYAHLSKLKVKEGYPVIKGKEIGLCGNTGNSNGAHLHYEIRIDGKAVNPLPYLNLD